MIVQKINTISIVYRNLCEMFQFTLLNSEKKLLYSDSSIFYRSIVIFEPDEILREVF